MNNILQSLDESVLFFINKEISNPFFDKIFPYITDLNNWLLVYLFLFGWLLWKGGKHGRIAVLALVIGILLSDTISSRILKEIFERVRPCASLQDVRLLVGCGGGLSFPSSHAVNMFCAATLLSFFYKQYVWVYFSIAAMIALSRVYVGVHYPFDILGGAFIGTIIGLFIIFIFKKIRYFQLNN